MLTQEDYQEIIKVSDVIGSAIVEAVHDKERLNLADIKPSNFLMATASVFGAMTSHNFGLQGCIFGLTSLIEARYTLESDPNFDEFIRAGDTSESLAEEV